MYIKENPNGKYQDKIRRTKIVLLILSCKYLYEPIPRLDTYKRETFLSIFAAFLDHHKSVAVLLRFLEVSWDVFPGGGGVFEMILDGDVSSKLQKHTRSLYQFFQNVFPTLYQFSENIYPTLYQFFKIYTRLYTNFRKYVPNLTPIFRKCIDTIPYTKIINFSTVPFTKISKIDTVPYTKFAKIDTFRDGTSPYSKYV